MTEKQIPSNVDNGSLPSTVELPTERRIPYIKGLGLVVWGLFALQLVVLIIEANTLYSRGELTLDYEVYGPAMSAISHFNFHPSTFLPNGRGTIPFIGNHFEWITWPFALLFGWLFRIPTWFSLLVLLQAVPTALVGPLGSYYARFKAEKLGLTLSTIWIVALLPSLLALTNIWLYWDSRFDFHFQALQGCLAVGVILAIELDQNIVALILGLMLMGAGETASILFLPIIIILIWRRQFKGSALALFAAIFTLLSPGLFGLVTADASSFPFAYGYLNPSAPPHSAFDLFKLILSHPSTFLNQLWANRLDVWSEIAASGFVGLASPLAIAAMVVVGLPAWGSGYAGFAVPIFQTLPIEQFLIFTSGVVMLIIIRKSWRWGSFFSILAIVWSLTWLLLFGPVLVRQLVAASSTNVGHSLHVLDATLPKSDVILSTNATLGDFVDHRTVMIGCGGSISLPKAEIDVVIDPWRGVQYCGPYELLQTLSKLASLPSAVVQGPTSGGVFVVHIDGFLKANRRVSFVKNQPLTGAFLIDPLAAHGKLIHTSTSAYVVSGRNGGFAISGIVASVKPFQRGEVEVKISVQGSASVQVWNDISGVVLASASLTSNNIESISLRFNSGKYTPPSLFTEGFGPFSTKLIAPLSLNPIEVRVWAPNGSKVSVFSTSIR